MQAVGKAAVKIVDGTPSVQEIPGIMEGTAKPEYGKCGHCYCCGYSRNGHSGFLSIVVHFGLTTGSLCPW